MAPTPPSPSSGARPHSSAGAISAEGANPLVPTVPVVLDGPALEARIAAVGGDLQESIAGVIDAVPTPGRGPQALAKALGVDKVLASRVLKAARSADPISATHRMPGPQPLRRLVQAAARRGAPPATIARATGAIDRFETLIAQHIGDRSLLDTILSAWVPEARREFEIRRKQSAFKAISQLRGVEARALLATVLLAPSKEPGRIDVIWINGLIGVHRVRPGVTVRVATRRMPGDSNSRQPSTLEGQAIEGDATPLLPEFCSTPLPKLGVRRVGDAVFYTLADDGFGAASAVDVVFAELSRGDLRRYVPPGAGRKAYVFAEVVPSAHVLQFDVLVHEDLYRGQDPALRIYDTSFEGVASANDPTREMDRLDMLESIEPLGVGLSKFRSADVPRYADLLRHVVSSAGFDAERLRGYRARIEYPIYGSQVTAVFNAVEHPDGADA